MGRAVCSSVPLNVVAPFLRTIRLDSCDTSRRFHEAVLRVIVPPSLGPSSLSSRAKRLPAVLAHPQSWWGGGLNSVTISQKCWSSLIELANATNSVKGSTKRGVIVQARTASPSIWKAFTHFMNDDARCALKPARWRCMPELTSWASYCTITRSSAVTLDLV